LYHKVNPVKPSAEVHNELVHPTGARDFPARSGHKQAPQTNFFHVALWSDMLRAVTSRAPLLIGRRMLGAVML
jgi:hypothetical protein